MRRKVSPVSVADFLKTEEWLHLKDLMQAKLEEAQKALESNSEATQLYRMQGKVSAYKLILSDRFAQDAVEAAKDNQ